MTRTLASVIATLLVSGCAAPKPRPMQLRRVTLYQNGIGYFERTGVLGGATLRLALARGELDDVLKTLTVIDRQGAGVATVDVPQISDSARTVAIDVRMAAGRAHDLLVGYAVPTPTWKAAYRVVLDEPAKPALLQAWAMVHNASQEDWRGVQLTLGTGAPMSFAQDMTKPQYVARPDVTGNMVQPTVLGPIGNENGMIIDRDGDAIPDAVDKCPDEDEAFNGTDDEDGCPDRGTVVVRDSSVVILEHVVFAANSETITPASQRVIAAAAEAMVGNPDIALVEIGGHTSSDEADGWALSARRATAVRAAMIANGVAPSRLEIQPYAAVQPLATNDTPAGREKNRRTSFLILKRADTEPVTRSIASRPLPTIDAAAMQASTHARTTPTGVAGSVRYVLTDPVTIGRGKSTMVSILNKPIAGDDVLLFRPDDNAPGSATHPFRAARLVNTSGFTLETGPIAIYAGGTFVGDSILDRLQVDETAWIPYALDGGTTVTRSAIPDERPIRLVAINRGVLTVENAGILTTTYTIVAGRDATRTIYIRHPKTPRYTPRDLPPHTIEQPDAYLVPIPLSAAKTSTLTIEEREPRRATIEIVRADDTTLAAYLEGAQLPAPILERIKTAAALRRDMATLDDDARKIRSRIVDISQRAIELRDSLRAIDKVRGADDLRKKLLAGLASTTAESDTLARSLGEKTEALATARARLAEAIRDLTIE